MIAKSHDFSNSFSDVFRIMIISQIFAAIIPYKENETKFDRVLALVSAGNLRQALNEARSMHQELENTPYAFMPIVEAYLEENDPLKAAEVLREMPDGEYKLQLATKIIDLQTKLGIKKAEMQVGIQGLLPADSEIDQLVAAEYQIAKQKHEELSGLTLGELSARLKSKQLQLEELKNTYRSILKIGTEKQVKDILDQKFEIMNELVLIIGIIQKRTSNNNAVHDFDKFSSDSDSFEEDSFPSVSSQENIFYNQSDLSDPYQGTELTVRRDYQLFENLEDETPNQVPARRTQASSKKNCCVIS